ncbi:MAG: imidazole glycerol phosphate synthase subunit HisH [Candidatus Marinimicrobia bacterium]|nr:imidazole glycerol phosphate synthase subunit HisH [Candidatus Neomarinimicrobiota bacterium]MDA1363880.1 imidazole glycerol phosphate synthase subunit HisH [Candidatus Neomarinimicrobiota bacterium]
MKKVAVIDYGAGNQKNIFRAIKAINCEPVLASKKSDLDGIRYIIVPGMGSFSVAVRHMKRTGLFEALIEAANSNKKILGICLGLQLFFEHGDEGGKNIGLGILKGKILPLENFCDFADDYKIPLMGWYKIVWTLSEETEFSKIINKVSDKHMYFAHSYGVQPENKNIELCTLDYYDAKIVAAIKKDNIFGTQFHPEKSGEAGLEILKAFIS